MFFCNQTVPSSERDIERNGAEGIGHQGCTLQQRHCLVRKKLNKSYEGLYTLIALRDPYLLAIIEPYQFFLPFSVGSTNVICRLIRETTLDNLSHCYGWDIVSSISYHVPWF